MSDLTIPNYPKLSQHADPMPEWARLEAYARCTGTERLTPAQRRRIRHKENKRFKPSTTVQKGHS